MKAVFRCLVCERTWRDVLPPWWTELEVWPQCCRKHARLVDVPRKARLRAWTQAR